MGKNNRARRAAKARQKARREKPWSHGEHAQAAGEAARQSVAEVVASTWYDALGARYPHQVHDLVDRLATLPAAEVDAHGQRLLLGTLRIAWPQGWQPTELRRQVRIATRAQVATLVELAIHADHADRAGQSVDPRWADQVAGMGERNRSVRGPWLAEWRDRNQLFRAESYEAVLEIWGVVTALRPIDVLIPYPGAGADVVTIGAPRREAGAHPMLDRIRKLLAKAEATEFEEEAALFTAKAQELMTRHAIDEAFVRRDEVADLPRMIRIPIDAPYADVKSALLGVVARANRCRAIGLGGCAMSSVLGHAGDLGHVELLFTSLLVQAQKALAEAGRGQVGGRARSASYRSSFLLAFADRIGERLESATEAVLDDEGSSAALPALRASEARVDDLIRERYGDTLVPSTIRGGRDYLGHVHGRQVADRARLDAGALTA